MNKRMTLSMAIGLSLLTTDPALASPKPCRDRSGRVIACPKPRTPSPRCKDGQGRFVACAPTGNPTQIKSSPQ